MSSMRDIREKQLATIKAVSVDLDEIEGRLLDVGLDSIADSLGEYSHIRRTIEHAVTSATKHIAEINDREYKAGIITAEQRFGPHDDHDDYIPGCPGCEQRSSVGE